jgi:hypothetical protein
MNEGKEVDVDVDVLCHFRKNAVELPCETLGGATLRVANWRERCAERTRRGYKWDE